VRTRVLAGCAVALAWLGLPFVCAAATDPKVGEEDLAIAGMVLLHDDCARSFPDLAADAAQGYAAWRKRNSQALSRIEANREFNERLKEDLQRIESGKRAPDSSERRQTKEYCDWFLASTFEAPSTAPASESPIAAWNGLVAAMRAGDTKKALTFFTWGARGRYREVLSTLGREGMRKAAEDFHDIEKYETMGDIAFAWTTRLAKDGTRHAYEISFTRDRRTGAWLIDSM
jgi:hypothetical protein